MRQETINKVINEFSKVFPSVTIPQIIWNPRMRSTAGRVKVCVITRQSKWIQLNPHLLQNEADLEQTLMHELCHVADCVIYGQAGHGRTWRHCMRLVGKQPKRCHQYDTSLVKRRLHKRIAMMQCSCRVVEITNTRLNKLLTGKSLYRCGKCKTYFKLLPKNEVA